MPSLQRVRVIQQLSHPTRLWILGCSDDHCPVEALVYRLAGCFRQEDAGVARREVCEARTLARRDSPNTLGQRNTRMRD